MSAPKGYDLNVEHFAEFLDNGLTEFENRTAIDIVEHNESKSGESHLFVN